MNKPQILTAKDLLRKSIELVSIVPEGTTYSIDTLKEPPAIIRLKQIETLLSALGISGTFENFLSANFMNDRNLAAYEKLFREMEYVYSRSPNATKLLKPGVGKLKEAYLSTFQYRLVLHNTLHYYKRAIIADPVFLYPIVIMKTINVDLLRQVDVLDNFLSAVIDPEYREIPISIMKEQYKYPDVDIELVDLDNF